MEHGKFVWNELNTHDAEKARSFYGETIGWQFDGMPTPTGETYWIAKSGEEWAAGIFSLAGPMFENVPDHWLAYLEVDNVDDRVTKVAAAGGTVMRAPFDVPNVGRFAIVRDGVGAVLGWMTSIKR